MCGIIGQIGTAAIEDRSRLVVGRDAMTHRGPDDAGLWWSDDGRVGLAQRRLAIIDLSPAGHQPMFGSRGRTVVVFNGEIYNYRDLKAELAGLGHAFRSDSDTEVILAAYERWGDDCLGRLNGIFAFALYDLDRRRVLLARDRAGEKPLFYMTGPKGLRFASEIKGLLAVSQSSPRIDPLALDCYLASGYVPTGLCLVQGVRKLPPAHALSYALDGGIEREWAYWALPDAPADDGADPEALAAELETLLEDAVGRQLVADVPVGVLLSGGVDSSLLTALAARRAERVKTFTIRFPGHGALDETEHARLIARRFGTDHVELEAGEGSVELLPALARQFDEPVNDSSMIPTYLISRLVRGHCTVALGGDGGDELFGGYSHYSQVLDLQRRLRRVPGPLRALAAGAAERLLPTGFRGRNRLRSFGIEPGGGLLPPALFDRTSRARLLAGRPGWDFGAEDRRRALYGAAGDPVQGMTRFDFGYYLPEDILVKVDRASMLNSLELRAPYLDYRVIEFAFGRVPSRLKATVGQRKIIPKLVAKRVLPAEFDIQRKQGFSIPLAAWLEKPEYGSFFREVLTDPSALFDRRELRSLLDGQAKGRSNSERLFGLVLFELWRREYGVTW